MTEERVRRRSRSAPTPRQSRAKATIPFDTAERRQRPARSADRNPRHLPWPSPLPHPGCSPHVPARLPVATPRCPLWAPGGGVGRAAVDTGRRRGHVARLPLPLPVENSPAMHLHGYYFSEDNDRLHALNGTVVASFHRVMGRRHPFVKLNFPTEEQPSLDHEPGSPTHHANASAPPNACGRSASVKALWMAPTFSIRPLVTALSR